MTNKEKQQAHKKVDIALCKLQDIFYLNATDRIASRLNEALDKVREIQHEIENTQAKR